jgi:hypothetical protein
LVSIKIIQGILHASYKQRQARTYTIANRTDQARDIIVEHPKQPGWTLVLDDKEKAPKETRDVYRFEVAVAPKKSAAVDVVLQRTRREEVTLTNSPDDVIALYVKGSKQPNIRQALGKALTLKGMLAELQTAMEQERTAVADLDKNQARLRENLKILEKNSDLYQSTIKRFEAQEKEFDQRHAKIAQLQTELNQQRRAYESYLRELNVE